MKYIRTKDGRIVKFGEQTDIGYEKGTFEVHNKTGLVASYEPIEIIKEADTIEELCDGYVIEHPIKAFKFFYSKEDTKKYLFNTLFRMFNLNELKIYALIRTDRGLIYVAKMNGEGKLELL